MVGAKYLERNVAALADGGRLIIIGMQGGTTAELNINTLLRKRGGIIATALRSRPVSGPGSKAEIVDDVRRRLWPMIEAGDIRPVSTRSSRCRTPGEPIAGCPRVGMSARSCCGRPRWAQP